MWHENLLWVQGLGFERQFPLNMGLFVSVTKQSKAERLKARSSSPIAEQQFRGMHPGRQMAGADDHVPSA